ncbi:MAG: YwaF family protein [Clostridia bacterium]|nr:YwaF family protein [Clostridia bacterium]
MFNPPNSETACGMFTVPHIISLVICFGLIALFVYLSRNITEKTLMKITRIMAVVFVIWEVCKIIFKFVIGDTYLDHWLPLYFCSLFIFALIFLSFSKGRIYKTGEAFISGGCIVSGLSYLIIPATSLMDFPIYHFLSIHSMLFHSCMVYLGIMYIYKHGINLDKKDYVYYSIFVGSFILLSLILNITLNQNFMIIKNPVNIPIDFVNKIANSFPWLYTLFAILLYMTIPFFTVKLVLFIIKKLKKQTHMR